MSFWLHGCCREWEGWARKPGLLHQSIDKILHQFATLLPNLTLLPILTLLPNFGGFHRTLQRVRLANRGRLLLRTPGPVPFGTCICSNVETILSWTCHVYGPFEFRTSLGTSILLCPYDISVGVWVFVIGLSQISSFFYLYLVIISLTKHLAKSGWLDNVCCGSNLAFCLFSSMHN